MDEYLSTSSTHPVLLRVPKLYENMDEATVGEWLVQEGELVNEGQLIVELITDKRTEQIPTTKAGRLLSIIAREKSVVPVGYILAVIGQ